jgi:hypothetical protein
MSTDERTAEQAIEMVREIARTDDAPTAVDLHLDRTREHTPHFTRMRTEWSGEEGAHVRGLKAIVDGRIMVLFSGAYVLMNDLYTVVREPMVDEDTGLIHTDQFGFPVWVKTESGAYREDYSNLGIRQREEFLFRITTGIFGWKQTAADLWGEAMFAKAQWEEAFSTGFVEPTGRLTVDDRTQRGRMHSLEERYFSIFQSLLSRKADGIISSLELLGQRIKDVNA